MVNKQEIEFIKINNINQAVGKNRMYLLKLPNENTCSLIITDLNGVRVPLKDLQGSEGGISSVFNTDGNLQITGISGIVINISPALLATINSALQVGDNISQLVNDVGYLEITDLPSTKAEFNTQLTDGDFLFVGDVSPSTNLTTVQNLTNVVIQSDTGTDATIVLANGTLSGVTENNFTTAEKLNLANQSNVNTGDNSTNTNSNAYADSKVVNTLLNGDTTHAPSSDIVYDELQLKENSVNKATTIIGNETSNILFGSIKAIVDWVTLLFVPKTRTLTIGSETFDLSADRTFAGGGAGGDEFLYYTSRWKSTGFNTNTWKNPGPSSTTFDNDAFGTYGTGLIPEDLTLYATWDSVPDGYIIDGVELEILYKSSGSASNIQVYIATGEVNYSSTSATVSTITELVNEVVSVPAGSFLMKFTYPLTVATNTLPTLDKKLIFKSVRDVTLNSVIYMFGFNFRFKKV